VAGSPSNGEVAFALSGPSAAAAQLEQIEVEELRINASPTESFVLAGTSGGISHVVYRASADGSRTETLPGGDASGAKHVHLLVRGASNGGLGPPMAAAPHFAMPGSGGALYGPALGSAALTLTDEGSSRIKALLRLTPPLTGSRFSLLIGHTGQTSANAGLPNEVTPSGWSAANVKGVFDARPTNITINARADAAGSERPVVAEFPTDPGARPAEVDFSGVARSLLKKAYPASTGSDLGLKLIVRCGTPGSLRVNLGTAAARYLSRPLAHGPAPLKLLGAPESLDLAVSAAFKPAAVSFTIDGAYGPARLTVDSDTAAPELRHGFRVGPSVNIARRIALTAAEANLPVVRLGIFGRTSEPSELLLSLHHGDTVRIGPPLAEPLSVEIGPSAGPTWHRKEFAAPGLLPPQPGMLWLVVRVARGSFWWHGSLGEEGFTQRSADDGATYTGVRGRPMLHVSVREVDPATGNPSPVYPVSLSRPEGLLNADLVGVDGIEASLPADFRRFWIAEGATHGAFLEGVPALGGLLRLTFHCPRDVDLTISDAVLSYDPWNS
jgi:hypothetical protein